MSEASSASAARKVEVMRLLAEALAPYLRDHFEDSRQPRGFYSQRDSPLGRRKHLALVRRGVLVGHRVGRDVLVRCEEVHAFIQSVPTTRASAHDEDDALSEWGVASRRST